jgi:uncharacterized protein YegP (UPF0339 family)
MSEQNLENRDVAEIYVGEDGDFYWRQIAPNGRIVAVAGEGYGRKQDAVESFYREQQEASRARVCVRDAKTGAREWLPALPERAHGAVDGIEPRAEPRTEGDPTGPSL